MIFSRVFLVLLLSMVGVWGEPPVRRQSSLSSPLAMGMRFLGNIRNGMTRTFQGLFGGGNQQSKEVNRPPKQPQLPPPEPAPIAPVHNIGFDTGSPAQEVVHGGFDTVSHVKEVVPHGPTEPSSSFFTVVHELPGASTAFPDSRGFTDESFSPSDFFTGKNPFQGKIEEETLPFHQEVTVPQQARQLVPQQHNQPIFQGSPILPQFPPRTTFGLEDAQPKPPVPSGNSNVFNHGNRLNPTQFSGTQEPLPGQLLDFPKPHSILSSRADGSNVKSPLIPSTQSSVTEGLPKSVNFGLTNSQSPTPSVQKAVLVGRSDSNPPVSLFVGQKHQRPTPAALQTGRFGTTLRAQISPEFREAKQQKELASKPSIQAKPSGHINTGIKMRLSPAPEDREGEEPEVSSYEFGYGVLDRNSGNQFFHAEKREEGLTKGSYKIQLPDGRVQTVTYQADKQGFRPKITYEGKAKYPATQLDKLTTQ